MKNNKNVNCLSSEDKNIDKFAGQFGNHDESESINYEMGIESYKLALENINNAYCLFENSPWGVPEEFDNLFGERQGNETLCSLQKEVEELIITRTKFI